MIQDARLWKRKYRELGWEPRTPLVEGLRRTISYAEKELADKTHAGMTWAEIS